MFTWTITDTRRFTGLVLTVRTNAPFVRIEQHNLLVEASIVKQRSVRFVIPKLEYPQGKTLFLGVGPVCLHTGSPLRKIEPARTRYIIFEAEHLLNLGSGKRAPTESATAQYSFFGFSTFTMRWYFACFVYGVFPILFHAGILAG